jgi:hypothetical protein
MFRLNKYLSVRDVVLAVMILRHLTYAPGCTQDTVVAEVENMLTNDTRNVRILRQQNNDRTTMRNKLKQPWRQYEQVPIEARNDVGHIPPLEAITQRNLKTSGLLSKYYLAHLLTHFSKDKALSLVNYASVTTSDIAFLWMLLIAFSTGTPWSGKRFSEAKEFIDAVCKPKNIVDWVHGHTELFKPVGNMVPAPARAASSHDSSADGSSSESEEGDSSGSSSSSSSSEEEQAAAKAPPIKKLQREGDT